METVKFIAIPREVEAVQVTADNMIEVAQWCGGTTGMADSVPFVRIRAQRHTPVQFTRALEGYWVVKLNKNYRVYSDDSFNRSFNLVVRDDVGTPLYDQVLSEVQSAYATQMPAETLADRLTRLANMHNVQHVAGRPYIAEVEEIPAEQTAVIPGLEEAPVTPTDLPRFDELVKDPEEAAS